MPDSRFAPAALQFPLNPLKRSNNPRRSTWRVAQHGQRERERHARARAHNWLGWVPSLFDVVGEERRNRAPLFRTNCCCYNRGAPRPTPSSSVGRSIMGQQANRSRGSSTRSDAFYIDASSSKPHPKKFFFVFLFPIFWLHSLSSSWRNRATGTNTRPQGPLGDSNWGLGPSSHHHNKLRETERRRERIRLVYRIAIIMTLSLCLR